MADQPKRPLGVILPSPTIGAPGLAQAGVRTNGVGLGRPLLHRVLLWRKQRPRRARSALG
jgi:hypothetical protein